MENEGTGTSPVPYSIIVVDDEAVIREGLENHIDWPSHGFRFLGAFEDGAQAVALLEREQVDIVISDISMPFLDGLELADVVGERFPQTKVILLTGHDRIDYAQEAVRLKVSNFLLKPITPAELRQVLDKTKVELDHERVELRNRARLRQQLAESLPLLRERVLNQLLLGRIGEEQTENSLRLAEISLPDKHFVVVLLDRDGEADGENREAESELDLLAVRNIADEINSRLADEINSRLADETNSRLADELDSRPATTHAFRDIHGSPTFIVGADTPRDATAAAISFGELLSTRVKSILELSVTIGISKPVRSRTRLPEAYRQAQFALQYRFLAGSGRLIEYAEAAGGSESRSEDQRNAATSEVFGPDGDAALFSLGAATLEKSQEYVRRLVGHMREHEFEIDTCRLILIRLIGRVLDSAEELSIDPAAIFPAGDPVETLATLKTLEQVETWLFGVLERRHDTLESRRTQRSVRKAEEARAFIHAHFADPDISVDRVCGAIGTGSSYFSQLFKAATGKTFVEYLTATRIERAKELLVGTDKLTYEIASDVGYRDPHYFSMSFKRYSGVTPRAFRSQRAVSVGGTTQQTGK